MTPPGHLLCISTPTRARETIIKVLLGAGAALFGSDFRDSQRTIQALAVYMNRLEVYQSLRTTFKRGSNVSNMPNKLAVNLG